MSSQGALLYFQNKKEVVASSELCFMATPRDGQNGLLTGPGHHFPVFLFIQGQGLILLLIRCWNRGPFPMVACSRSSRCHLLGPSLLG